MSSTEQGQVSASDIADIFGVSRAAVSNWRKRMDDFPPPVAGTAAKPLFSRQAITAWLEPRGHHPKKDDGQTQVWSAMNLLRGALSIDQVTDLLLTLLVARKTATPGAPEWGDTDPRTRVKVQDAINQIAADELGTVADFALERLTKSAGKKGAELGFVGSRTSALLANCAAAQPNGILYDPACGIAEALLEAVALGARPQRVIGHENNSRAGGIAEKRAVLRDVPLELVLTDVLVEDVDPNLRADTIILEPPFGQSFEDTSRLSDPRFEFGTPPRNSADTAWLQHVIAHLTPTGRGYVLTPAGTLMRGGGEARIRTELLLRGCVEAIVGMPGKMLPITPIPLALWVLRRPNASQGIGKVLFIDASEEESPEKHTATWLNNPAAREDVPHVEVPVADVLADDSVLTPQHWIDQTPPEPDEVAAAYAGGWTALEAAIQELQNHLSNLNHLTTLPKSRVITVGELIDQEVLDLHTGRSKERYNDATPALRERVVTVADVRKGTLRETSLDEHHDELPELTQKHDVLVATMNTICARVDPVGGHLAATGVHRLRVLDQNFLSPAYLAMALTGSWNERFQVGSTIQRAAIRDLEIPLVPRAIQDAASSINELQNTATHLATQANTVGAALLDAIRYNTPLTNPDPEPDADTRPEPQIDQRGTK